MSEELSTIDLKILEQVQANSAQSTAELAEKVGLSQSPCWRRLQRLKEEGYIKGEVAIVDRERFGSSLFIFATLCLKEFTDEKREAFMRKVAVTPEILECYTTFGDRDIIMKIYARSLPWYQDFVFNRLLKFPGVSDVQSMATLTEIKCTTAIPVRGNRAM